MTTHLRVEYVSNYGGAGPAVSCYAIVGNMMFWGYGSTRDEAARNARNNALRNVAAHADSVSQIEQRAQLGELPRGRRAAQP